MQMTKDVQTLLGGLLEDDLRIKILIPLLKAMGAHPVVDMHGRNEKGKDLYFSYKDIFKKDRHCCVFIKAGDITKSGGNDIRSFKGAIEEALDIPLSSPIDFSSKVFIEEFYFICNGKINRDANDYLASEVFDDKKFRNFRVFDLNKLSEVVRTLIRDYSSMIGKTYVFSCDSFEGFCQKIISHKDINISGNLLPISSEVESGVI